MTLLVCAAGMNGKALTKAFEDRQTLSKRAWGDG